MTHEPTNDLARGRVKSTRNRPIFSKINRENAKNICTYTSFSAANDPTRCEAASGECPSASVSSGGYNGQTRLRLTEHSSGVPTSDRLSLLPAYFLSKIGDNGPAASCRTVRRASHRQFSEEPGRNATDYAMSFHPTMTKDEKTRVFYRKR